MQSTYVERLVRLGIGLLAMALLLTMMVQLSPGRPVLSDYSLVTNRPVGVLVSTSLGITLKSMALAMLYALPLALLLGVPAGLRPNSLVDRILQLPAVALTAIPAFTLVLLSIRTLAFGGTVSIPAAATTGLVLLLSGWLARAVRDGLAQAGARAVVSILGRILQQTGNLLAVTMVVDISGGTSAAGLGRLLTQAVMTRDLSVVHRTLLVVVLLTLVSHFVGDLLVTLAGGSRQADAKVSRTWLAIGGILTAGLLILPLFGGGGLLQDISLTNRLQPPGAGHLLGTDALGRDMFSRVALGARVSLTIAFGATFLAMPLAAIAAAIGRAGGKWGAAIMSPRVAVPGLLGPIVAGIAFSHMAQPGLYPLMLGLGVASVPAMTQAFRQGFNRRLVPMAGLMLLVLGQALLAENILSFMGFGAQPPTPSLGSVVQQAMPHLRSAPHLLLAAWPGALGLAGLFLVGHTLADGARDEG